MKIVAELGINTNGDLDTALRMVEAAAEAGADGVKVQAYRTADFLPVGHSDWDLFEDNRLAWSAIERVQDEVVALGMEFGATPTSVDGVQMLASLKVDWLKNGSDFLLRTDLIEAMLATGIETWVSVGMATDKEVFGIHGSHRWPANLKVMACTSVYPCPDDEANLLRVNSRSDEWFPEGYSDHTTGTTAAVMAVALGAEMWEGHLTLDHALVGPDHRWSRTPSEMAELVREVRRAEAMLGSGNFEPSPSELVNRDAWRVTEGTLRG